LLSLADFGPDAPAAAALRRAGGGRFRRTGLPLFSFVIAPLNTRRTSNRGPPAGGLRWRLASPLTQPVEFKIITADGDNDGKRLNKSLTREARYYSAFYLTEPFGSHYKNDVFRLLRQIFCARIMRLIACQRRQSPFISSAKPAGPN
jgi:hypothetical protein